MKTLSRTSTGDKMNATMPSKIQD